MIDLSFYSSQQRNTESSSTGKFQMVLRIFTHMLLKFEVLLG